MVRQALFAVVLSTVAPQAMAAQASPELPPGVASEVAQAWLDAIASADSIKIRHWIERYDPEGDVNVRVKRMLETAGRTGGFNVVKATAQNARQITLRLKSRRDDGQLELELEVEPGGRAGSFLLKPVEPGVNPLDPSPRAPPEVARPSTKPLPLSQLPRALDQLIGRLVQQDSFSGSVLIAKGDRVVYGKAFGLASRDYHVPNTLTTRFNLGSVNKLVTTIAIAQLSAAGKLSLDDTIGKFLSDYPNSSTRSKVTIRHLLTMKSGIGDFFGPEFRRAAKEQFRTIRDYLPLFASAPLAFEPGTQTQYSNGGFVVLGAIIEAVSGQTYYDYVRDHIYRVAGMRETDSFAVDDIVPNLAMGYTTEEQQGSGRHHNLFVLPARGSSAGGGYSTAPDLLRLSLALQHGLLRLPASRDGPLSQMSDRLPPIGVAGGSPGVNAFFFVNPESGFTLVVLSNYDPPSAVSLGSKIRTLLPFGPR